MEVCSERKSALLFKRGCLITGRSMVEKENIVGNRRADKIYQSGLFSYKQSFAVKFCKIDVDA